MRHSDLERKNGQIELQKPRREKNEHEMKAHRSSNGAHCLHGVARACREFCSPRQARALCQPCSKGTLCTNQYHYDPHEPTTKAQHCSMVRSAVEHSKFDNAERVTAHGPRKHAHDSMACHEVPLGYHAFWIAC